MHLKNNKLVPSAFFQAILTTLFLGIFYNTVTNTAGVYIASDLGGSPLTSVYAMVFFGLGNLVTIPLAAPLSLRFGSLRVLSISLFVYTVFSILCSTAPTFFLFNVHRFGLGLASGFFFIICRQLITSFAPEEKQEHYSFISIVMFAVVPVLGVCFGAFLAYESFWRWIFHLNNPFSLFLAYYFWKHSRSMDDPPQHAPFDKVGYLFYVIGFGTLVTAATLAQELDWYRSTTLCTLTLIGIPCLLFFLLWSRLHPTPILELHLLKNKHLAFSLFNLGILFSCYFGMIILITLWLNIYANYTPVWIAALIGIMGASGLIAFLISHTILKKLDPRIPLALAILCFASSCYYSTYFDVEVDLFHLAVARSLSGMGLVLFLFPLFNISAASFGSEKIIPVFTLFQATRVLFCSLGAGFYVILWQRRQAFFHERLGEGLNATSQLTAQYFDRATHVFGLTKERALAELSILLDNQATSLALNDVFGFMGYVLLALFCLLLFSFFITPYQRIF